MLRDPSAVHNVFQAIRLPTASLVLQYTAASVAGADLPGAWLLIPATAAPLPTSMQDAPYSPTVIPNPNL